MRLAVEEAYAQFVQAAGDEAAGQRVDEARAALAEHFRQLRETLTQQQRDVTEAKNSHQQQADELIADRHRLSEWLAERESRLQDAGANLRSEAAQLDSERGRLSKLRARQIDERMEAEHVIRDLLKQITELTDAMAVSDR